MNTRGFTIVEIMVALSLLAILGAAVLSSQMANVRANIQTEIRMQGNTVVRQGLEELRSRDILPVTGSEKSDITSGRTFEVVKEFCPSSNDPPCTPTSIHVRVTANYEGKPVSSADTVFTKVNTSASLGGK